MAPSPNSTLHSSTAITNSNPQLACSVLSYPSLFMETLSLQPLQQLLSSSYISTATAVIRYPLSKVPFPRFSGLFTVLDSSISFYFRYNGLSPCTVNIDDDTYMHFWAVNNPKPNKPNLVLIHGYGADSKWQFVNQITALSKCFNVYAPDLIFFGKSYSKRPERSDMFQATCVVAGLKKLGVLRYSLFGISYGGYVVYRMAQLNPDVVEKVVIASCGISCSKEMLSKQVSAFNKDFREILLPQKPQDFRLLVNFSFGKGDPFKWLPDAFIQLLIDALGKDNLKDKIDLAECLLGNAADDSEVPNITQETLLLWGEKDKVFPVSFGIDLQRKLGSKATLEIIKNSGHALNMESGNDLNNHIKAFILGSSRQQVDRP